MLILILPATFIVVFFCLQGYHHYRHTPLADWRMSILQAATLLGGYMVLFSELLSLFHALTTVWVAAFWGAALIFSTILGWRNGWILEGFHSLKSGWTKPGWFDILAGTIVTIILALLFVVAVKSPVNNNDSLQYHMSRVVHWAQNSGLQHYATSYVPQLVLPINAELVLLQLRLLAGNDHFANLYQYFCLVAVLIGVSAISSLFVGNKVSKWFAIAFCLSIPMGILQATSTQNDLVTAFWLITLAYITIISVYRELSWLEYLSFGLCLGLGMLTKGTFFPYALPLIILFIYARMVSRSFFRFIRVGIAITILVLLINSGYWARNLITYKGIFGPKEWVTSRTSQTIGIGPLSGAIIRNIAINFASPSDRVNHLIEVFLKNSFKSIDPTMKLLKLTWAWNHEDFAGNPLQLLLVIISLVIIIIRYRKIEDLAIRGYTLAIVGMYIFYSQIITYDIFGIRYELTWLIACSPLIAIAGELVLNKHLLKILTLLLLLSTFPWVLFNRTRPLIAMRDSSDPYTIPCYAGCTVGSILIEPPEKTMFAVWGSLGNAYVDAMQLVKSTGCQDVGLKLDSHDLEYAYWWLLGAPQNGMRLESIVTYPELERYLVPDFKPCVVICSTCGEQSQLFGLERIGSFGEGRIKIFSGDNYNPNNP